ncbi:uncharacterized protein RJT21DRAFT_111285 [Scheffersomyces amazonensis]|uniref:uncharacterized protein n=1 Tax=Scheffersomyces amazonensis TaxID=1078765 RepID=UPI00315C8F2E
MSSIDANDELNESSGSDNEYNCSSLTLDHSPVVKDPFYHPVFNKNAIPFVPLANYKDQSSTSSIIPPMAATSGLSVSNKRQISSGPYNIQFSNLPSSITLQNLSELIDSIIETNFDPQTFIYNYEIINFTRSNELEKSSTKSPDIEKLQANEVDSTYEADNEQLSTTAIVQVYDWTFCSRLIDLFNGYEWQGKTLDVNFITSSSNDSHSSSISSLPSAGSSANSSISNLMAVPPPNPYNNSYFPSHAPQNPPYLTPIMPPQYDYGFGNNPSQPLIPGQMYPLPPIGTYANHTPRQFLFRRSSSAKSFDSMRRSSRNNSIASARNSSSFSSLSSSSFSNSSSMNQKQPVPPFIMNMVANNRLRSSLDSSPSDSPVSESPIESQNQFRPNDLEYINSEEFDLKSSLPQEVIEEEIIHNEVEEIGDEGGPKLENELVESSSSIDSMHSEDYYILTRNDEDTDFIKVNPKRLFVGNVPYSSTWASLRNFFVTKAKELDPESNIIILRVEIPMQPAQNIGGDDNPYDIIQSGLITKSRGFAIVTTGNKESSQKLIELFDNMQFEGRSLTVRYDKFPEFNNYLIQQIYNHTPYSQNIQKTTILPRQNQIPNHQNTFPYNAKNYGNISRNNSYSGQGPSIISNLAFERNSLQQKYYYASNINQLGNTNTTTSSVGTVNNPMGGMVPTPNAGNYFVYPYYYGPQPLQNLAPLNMPQPNLQTNLPGGANYQGYMTKQQVPTIYSTSAPHSFNIMYRSGSNKLQSQNQSQNQNQNRESSSSISLERPGDAHKIQEGELNDEDKARELANSLNKVNLNE